MPSRSNGVASTVRMPSADSTVVPGNSASAASKVMDMDRLPVDDSSANGRATINDPPRPNSLPLGSLQSEPRVREHCHRRERSQHLRHHTVLPLARQSHRAPAEDRPASGRSSAGSRSSPLPARVTRRERAAMTEYFPLVSAEIFSPQRGAALPLIFREPFLVVEAIKRPSRAS